MDWLFQSEYGNHPRSLKGRHRDINGLWYVIDQIVMEVPGSFELIYGCQRMISHHQDLDAIIAIGSVIEGETKHFDFVCSGVTQGIKDLNLMGIVPVIFCVLTDQTLEQAQARSGGKHGNKGVEAAVAALEMAVLGMP